MEIVENGGHVTKPIIRYIKDNVMSIPMSILINEGKLTVIEQKADKAFENFKEKSENKKNSNIPFFEEGTLESLLNDVKIQRGLDEEENERV